MDDIFVNNIINDTEDIFSNSVINDTEDIFANNTTNNSQPVSNQNNKSSDGEGVKIKYDAVLSICDNLDNIVKDLKEQWETISTIIQTKDTIWTGDASERFFKALNDTNIKAIETTENKGLPSFISHVRELVDLNKQTDSQIMGKTLMTVNNARDNVQANQATVVANGVNEEIINATKTNANVQSNTASVTATGVNDDIFASIKTNDNVQEINADVSASGVNTGLINEVKTNNSFNSQSVSDNLSNGVNTDVIETLSVDGN